MKRSEERRYSSYDNPRNEDSEHYPSYHENRNHLYRRKHRHKNYEQPRYERPYTLRDNADSEHYRSYNENRNYFYRRKHRHKRYEQPRHERPYSPRDNVETERSTSTPEDGYHGTPRPKNHDQHMHRRSYDQKDDADSEHYPSYYENRNYFYRGKHRHKKYEQSRHERPYSPRDYAETERSTSTPEDGYHGTPRPKNHDQHMHRRSYDQKDDESEEQATKYCPRTTDPPPYYKDVIAQHQAPLSLISKERLIDHQDKCKLPKDEITPAAKAINSFIKEFIKKLKEISTLNWNYFNSGSYYDKTKNCHPDEFDIMIYPNLSVEVNFDDMKIPSYYKVKMVSPRVKELKHVLDKNRYIVPDKFKKYVFGLFDRVLGPEGIRQGRKTTKKSKPDRCSPAYTVFYNPFPEAIDIDIVPCFIIDGWPPDKITRKINPPWIAIDDVVNRAMKSYDVVCKTCPEDATDKNLLFRLSFSRTEKMLVTHANSADKLNFKKNAFRFIKLCIQDLKDKHPRKVQKFCSYHIKQFMFSQYDTWPTRESEEVRIQRCLIGELIKTLSLPTPTIMNYFIKNDNVIKYVPSKEIAVIVKGLEEKVKLLH